MAYNVFELGSAIEKELTIYSQKTTDQIKETTITSMKKLVKLTKDTAPVGHRKKHFKSNIKSRTLLENDKAITKQWYVDGADYRLSHLLENGHAKKNGGRVEGTHFISKAETEVVTEYEQQIEEAIKNGK